MTAANDTGRPIYFDITEILSYASANSRVSGIERVQFNLIGYLVRSHGGQQIRCVFYHPARGSMVELDPTALFDDSEFDAGALLQRLGLERASRVIPAKREIKESLRRFERKKFRRALAKLDIYVSALLMPWRLSRLGLPRPSVSAVSIETLPLLAVQHLPVEAAYVLLSFMESAPEVTALAKQHAEQGGDVVQFVYDLIPLVRPKFVDVATQERFGRWIETISKLATSFICISEWTAKDLRTVLGERLADCEIHVVSLAHEFHGFARGLKLSLDPPALARLPSEPFVLCVGTIEVRKNGVALLRAWQSLLADFNDKVPTLVFAGRMGWLLDEFIATLNGDEKLKQHVCILPSPSDQELAWLYGHCLFTAYPSHYEGWGLPVGESAWFNRYCIASTASSIPEVCSDLMDYAEPTDQAALERLIRRALQDPAYVQTKQAAIERAPLRRWRDVADDMYRFVSVRSDGELSRVAPSVSASQHAGAQ